MGYPSGGVEVWDAQSGDQLHFMQTYRGGRNGTDNFLVLGADGRTAYVPVCRQKAVPIEKDGKQAWIWQFSGEVQAWDLESGRQLPSIVESPTHGFPHCAVSPDGSKLLVNERESTGARDSETDGQKQSVVLWDLPSRTRTVLAEGYALPILSPDGRLIAATVSASDKQATLRLWDAASGNAVRTLYDEGHGRIGRPFFSHDARLIAAVKGNPEEKPPEVWLWEVATGRHVATLPATEKGYLWYRLAFSPNDRLLAAAQRDIGHVYVFDVSAGNRVRTIDLGKTAGPREPVFSPDGRRLAIAAAEIPEELKRARNPDPADMPQPRIFLVDLTAGGDPEVIVCPHGTIGDLAFSPDGKLIALGGYGCVWLFDARPTPERRTATP